MSGTNNARAALEPSWMSTDNSGGGNGGGSASQIPKNNGSVKAESNQPMTTGGFKPKFVPKVPVKKEVVAPVATTTSSADASASGNKSDQHSSKNDGKGPRKNGSKPLVINKFTPRNKSVGFKDGPQSGARKWVMPVGAAFFTGTNAVGSSSSSSAVGTTAATVSTTAMPGSISNPVATGRIARPNEKIDKHPTKVVKSASNSSFVAYMGAQESDSDAEDDDDAQQNDDDEDDEGREMWPPVEYDPLAPLALPLGPRTLTMRNQLAAEPILADPADDAAIEKEQSSSLFVLQMPTDLKLEKYQMEASSDVETRRVHIGKMQLLRSGKVQLVSTDGDLYEVNSGMASSFVQILSSIDVPGGEISSAEGKAEGGNSTANTTAAQSNSSSSRGGGVAAAAYGVPAQPEDQSSLYLMGSITKKLVLTPCHDIGVRRPRSYSVTTAAHKNLPGELLYAMGQPQQGGRGYVDEDEMVVDV